MSERFWKLSCRKSARRCGAKQISKSKCTKHLSVGALLEVELSKKCMRLWRIEEDLERCILRGVETHESDMLGGPGADFLRGAAFWSITSSGLPR